MCQKRLYVSADFLHSLGVVLAARIPQASQKGIYRPLRPALQNIIDCPYSLGSVCAVVMLRPHIFQKISGPDADLLASLDFSMLVYNIRLLKVSRNVCPCMLVDVLPSAPPFCSQLLPRSLLRPE